MEPSHRARWRSALLLLPLVAAAAVDGQAPTTHQARYERIIAPGETPKKLTDGFTLTEGPPWLKGKLN